MSMAEDDAKPVMKVSDKQMSRKTCTKTKMPRDREKVKQSMGRI